MYTRRLFSRKANHRHADRRPCRGEGGGEGAWVVSWYSILISVPSIPHLGYTTLGWYLEIYISLLSSTLHKCQSVTHSSPSVRLLTTWDSSPSQSCSVAQWNRESPSLRVKRHIQLKTLPSSTFGCGR